MARRNEPDVDWPFEEDAPSTPRSPTYRLQAEREIPTDEEDGDRAQGM